MEIMVLGNVRFLELVFDGIVAITGDGNYWRAIQVALGLGVLVTVSAGIFTGGRSINFGGLIGTFLLILVGFSVTTTVVLTSARNPTDVRVVANVPMAVAGPATIISNFGYWMTDWMATAFGRPHRVTVEGFRHSFETLKLVRFSTRDHLTLAPLDGHKSGSFYQTATNYLDLCVFNRLNRRAITINDVLNQNNWRVAIAYPNDASEDRFQILMGPMAGSNVRCAEAWNVLMPGGLGTMEQEIDAFIDRIFDTKLPAVFQNGALAPPTATDVQTRIENSMADIGVVGVSARDLVGAMLLVGLFDAAHIANSLAYMDFQWAQMVRDGIRQRNAQWSAESSLFVKIIDPMITFMEGFAYGTIPMVAILVALGTFGFGFIVRYMLMLLWLQTWLPGLAIIDLYLSVTMDEELTAVQAVGGTGVGSLAGVLLLETKLATAIAWGEHMAAVIPFLTAGFVWGGAVAATSLASQVSRGDFINEKRMIPDRTNAPEVFQRAPERVFDEHGGMRKPGAEPPKVQFSSTNAETVRLAETASQEASIRLQNALRNAHSEGFSFATEFRQTHSTRQGLSYQESETAKFLQNQTNAISDRLGASIREGDAVTIGAKLDMVQALSLGGKPGMAAAIAADRLGIGGGANWQQTTQGQALLDMAHTLHNQIQNDRGFSQGLSEALSRDVQQSHSSGGAHTLSDQTVREVAEARSQAMNASRFAEWASQNQNSMGTTMSIPVNAIAQAMIRHGDMFEYRMAAQETGNQGHITRLAAMLEAQQGYDPHTAWASAFVLHMSDSQLRMGPVEGDPATVQKWAHRAISAYLPHAAPSGPDPDQAEALRSAAPPPDMSVAAPSGGSPTGRARDLHDGQRPVVEAAANQTRDDIDMRGQGVGQFTEQRYNDAREKLQRPEALDQAAETIANPSNLRPGSHAARAIASVAVPDSAHLPREPAGGTASSDEAKPQEPLTLIIPLTGEDPPNPNFWPDSPRLPPDR
ncbi:MAG: hypothetical protein EA356_12470 [Geminicoccaceae bacterium]|nr:MAG: hypothetical protein EA356_12470 [Geminicoccaceae bacterium]